MENVSRRPKIISMLILLGGGIVLALIGGRYLNVNDFITYKNDILTFTKTYFYSSLILYFIVYTLAVAFSFPGALILTLIGGLLFGTIIGGFIIILAATTGATLLFLIAHRFSDVFFPKVGEKLEGLRKGFNKNAFNYLLFLRLTPIFPFWLVNLAPAFLNVRLSTFMAATLIGIAPATFIFASLGAGLDALIGENGLDTKALVSPAILFSLGGLGLLSLLPILFKKFGKTPDDL